MEVKEENSVFLKGSFEEWVLINKKILNEKGETFQLLPFMYDVIQSMYPAPRIDGQEKTISIEKPAQVGLTYTSLLFAIYLCDVWGLEVIYVMPNGTKIQELVDGKLNRIIAYNKSLQALIKDTDNKYRKKIGRGMLYMKTAENEREATSVSGDVVIVDEIDTCDQRYVVEYRSRTQRSATPLHLYFSHPSVPDFSIDKYYQDGTMNKWYFTCACDKESFVNDVIFETGEYTCQYCDQVVDPTNGYWKKTNDSINESWHISAIMSSEFTAKRLIAKQNEVKTQPHEFYRKTLGVPYIDASIAVNEQDILKNCTYRNYNGVYKEYDISNDYESIIIGIDPNKDMRILIGSEKGVLWLEEFPTVTRENPDNGFDKCCEFIDYYIKQFKKRDKIPKVKIIIDGNGDISINRKLFEKYRINTWLVTYGPVKQSYEFLRWKDEAHSVDIDVNKGIDELIVNFEEGRIEINGSPNSAQAKDLAKHFKSLYAHYEDTANNGVRRKIWKTTSRKDYVLCALYYLAGRMRFAS